MCCNMSKSNFYIEESFRPDHCTGLEPLHTWTGQSERSPDSFWPNPLNGSEIHLIDNYLTSRSTLHGKTRSYPQMPYVALQSFCCQIVNHTSSWSFHQTCLQRFAWLHQFPRLFHLVPLPCARHRGRIAAYVFLWSAPVLLFLQIVFVNHLLEITISSS